MSDAPDTPDWSCLPHDAQRFFALDDGFDRKDLKRSYNRWIRKFKPETFPAEFQKIRAAYEQLDQSLRYGGTMSLPSETRATQDWSEQKTTEPSSADTAGGQSSRHEPIALTPDLHERVETESHADLYAELQRKPEKSPYDYYALALMSDVCDRRDGLQFARWLLEGLRQHDGDPNLGRVLQAYFRGPLPKGALAKLLQAAAKSIRRDIFYPITEAGWEKLVREESLETFVATLRKCEGQLRDIGIAGKMAFTIRILRLAFWKTRGAAPQFRRWAEDAMEFIESNFEQIPGELEFEVDLLGYIAQYQQVREQFIAGGTLRAEMDAALEAFFLGEPGEADHAIVAQQLAIASDPDRLLAAYPITNQDDPGLDAFFPLWAWISGEVIERTGDGEDEEEIDVKLWAGRAHALLVQLEAKSDGSSTGQIWNISGFVLRVAQAMVYLFSFIAAFLLVFLPGLAVVDSMRWDSDDAILWMTLLGTAAGAASAYFAGRWLSKQLVERVYHPFCGRMALRSYNKLWRRDALDLLGRSRLPYTLFRDLLGNQATYEISTSHWVANHVSQDYALALYSYAQRHVF